MKVTMNWLSAYQRQPSSGQFLKQRAQDQHIVNLIIISRSAFLVISVSLFF